MTLNIEHYKNLINDSETSEYTPRIIFFLLKLYSMWTKSKRNTPLVFFALCAMSASSV